MSNKDYHQTQANFEYFGRSTNKMLFYLVRAKCNEQVNIPSKVWVVYSEGMPVPPVVKNNIIYKGTSR